MTTRRIMASTKFDNCPRCGQLSKRHSVGRRKLREIGIRGPTVLLVTYSKHYCEHCRKHFSKDLSYLAPPSGRFTHRVRKTAVELYKRGKNMTFEKVSIAMRARYYVYCPPTSIHEWWVEELAADVDKETRCLRTA